MARNQKNFENHLYIDDGAVHWTKRGEIGGAADAIDGHAAHDGSPTWIDTARMKVRRVVYQDPVTFRTLSPIIYTAAAFTAIDLGETVSASVEGLATTVTYTAIKKLAERQPSRGTSRKLADS